METCITYFRFKMITNLILRDDSSTNGLSRKPVIQIRVQLFVLYDTKHEFMTVPQI